MKKFEAPVLEIVDELTMEPVYAASGYVPKDDDKPTPCGGDWDIHPDWRGHNSGGHSELHIGGHNNGKCSGEGITMHFQCVGFKLDYVKDTSGYQVFNVNENSFSMYRQGHFNPGETIGFVIQLVAKDTQYHGAVGKSGEGTPCRVVCTSYTTC